MTKKSKGKSGTFGDLVKAKLTQRGWNQRELGRSIRRGPTYISYLIRNENPSTRGGKFRPARDVVEDVARVLEIPLDEALKASGYEPLSKTSAPDAAPTAAPASAGAPAVREPSAPNGKTAEDQRLFDIAYNAAVEALRSRTAGKTAAAAATGRIKIDLSDGARIVLSGTRADLTEDDIDRYERAFRMTYGSVTAQIAEKKK
jgi:transcriptional regulator with XRE-family HTH domain